MAITKTLLIKLCETAKDKREGITMQSIEHARLKYPEILKILENSEYILDSDIVDNYVSTDQASLETILGFDNTGNA